jgi:hypothetical protein
MTRFDLTKRSKLVTLRDAANYIMKLPKAEHSTPEWQAAMQALILVAENGGPPMLARIGVMRGLDRHQVRVLTFGATAVRMGVWSRRGRSKSNTSIA